jgi:hypothetical protein
MSSLEKKKPYRFMIDRKAFVAGALYYVRLKDLYLAEQK